MLHYLTFLKKINQIRSDRKQTVLKMIQSNGRSPVLDQNLESLSDHDLTEVQSRENSLYRN